MKIIIGLLVVLACIGSILAPAAQAQVDLGIYPPIIQIDATPPAGITAPFTIQNYGTDPLDLEIQMKPFQSSSENTMQGDDPQILQKVNVLDGDQTIDQIILAPQQEKQLNLQINVPKGEPPSDYYFSILFLSKSEGVNGKSISSISAGIGTNVLLSIGPKDTTTGFLREFSAPWYVNHGPVPFQVLIKNTSRHFIFPKASIVIKNMFGQTVGNVDLEQSNILAHSKRFLDGVWPEKVLFGAYRAQLTIALSDSGPLFTKSIYFLALPVEYGIGLILTCLVIANVIWNVKKRMK